MQVRGRIFPMIELNAGLHPELTGRENVYLLGAVMGLSTREVTQLLPEIEAFCELEEWFDRPVRMYSSGMLARLGFAVAVNVDADVLLIDEVLAVGDITFQRKCFDRIERLHNSGKTVIFVSHSIRQVERLCDRALLMERGAPVACGETVDVISEYYQAANLHIVETTAPNGETVRLLQEQVEDALVEILAIRYVTDSGKDATTFHTGDPITIVVDYRAREPVAQANIGMAIFTVDSFFVSGVTNDHDPTPMPLAGDGSFRCRISKFAAALRHVFRQAEDSQHERRRHWRGGRAFPPSRCWCRGRSV